jgi:uncharacterized membrane protein (DUF485 family)
VITDFFSDLNWAAVIVAALAWFGFSAVWYSLPPLSRIWQRESKVDMSSEGPPLVSILLPTFIGYLITTIVIALIVEAVGATTMTDAVTLGVTLGIGFGMVSALVAQLYERKGNSYWLINGVNSVIAFTIVTALLTAWE